MPTISFGLRPDQELQAALFERLLQQLAGGLVELALHQQVRQVHHGDLHAALHQAVGRFQAEQAAADDHRVPVLAVAASIMASTSAMSRKPITPGRSLPGTGRMKGLEPVASSRRS